VSALTDLSNNKLPKDVTFAYDLCFGRTIAHWKVISEDYTFFHHTLG
jgi:hypothetical protein